MIAVGLDSPARSTVCWHSGCVGRTVSAQRDSLPGNVCSCALSAASDAAGASRILCGRPLVSSQSPYLKAGPEPAISASGSCVPGRPIYSRNHMCSSLLRLLPACLFVPFEGRDGARVHNGAHCLRCLCHSVLLRRRRHQLEQLKFVEEHRPLTRIRSHHSGSPRLPREQAHDQSGRSRATCRLVSRPPPQHDFDDSA